MLWIGLAVGFFLGANFGVLTMALFIAGKRGT